MLKKAGRVLYEDAWTKALSQPMTWDSDLKEWIREWQKDGSLTLVGLQPRQQVPRREENNYLAWKRKDAPGSER